MQICRCYIESVLGVFFLLSLFCTSCIKEDLSDCRNYDLTMKVVDAEGEDISSSGAIHDLKAYLFGNDKFIKELPIDSGKITFTYSKSVPVTVVAWGNLQNDTLDLPQLTSGMGITEALVQLKKSNTQTLSAPDLFYQSYSSVSTKSDVDEEVVELSLKRRTAQMHISFGGIITAFGGTEDEYSYIIKGAGYGLNFKGEALLSDEHPYKPTTSWNTLNRLETPIFSIIPDDNNDDYVQVNLYKGEKLVYSIQSDTYGNKLKAVPGKMLNVIVDFATIYINVSIVSIIPWGQVQQQVVL